MQSTPVRPNLCPGCGRESDMASDLEGVAKPGPGDFTICYNCGELMRFGPDMSLVKTTDDEVQKNVEASTFIKMFLMRAAIRARGKLPRRGIRQ